jgi:hypothetical protein
MHSESHSYNYNTFFHLHSPRPLSISSLHLCSVGKNLPVVPSRESNSGLPYSKPTRYQLSHFITYDVYELGKMQTVREDGKEFEMYRKGKDIRKKRHQMFKLPNLCVNQLIST